MRKLWRGSLWALSAVGVLSACGGASQTGLDTQEASDGQPAPHSERAGIGLEASRSSGRVSALSTTIDPRRSLAVTETAILSGFTAQSVFDQLAAQNGPGGFSGVQLFRQLWDTQNPAPGKSDLMAVTSYAHCSDNGGTLNGAPYACRPGEGAEANDTTSATLSTYTAVGLYNRFDLAPSDGANCGEYRVVFAKTGGPRNFIIFEAVLPNPQPVRGLEGCRPIQNFWASLTADTNVASRANKLHHFYFDGTDGLGTLLSPIPVIHIDNYGGRSSNTGQVRTNQFIAPPWMLHEFKLQHACFSTSTTSSCATKFTPVTVKTNPFGGLFNPASTDSRAASFQSQFVSQVASLAINDVNTFNYTVPDTFNAGQSDAQTTNVPDNYLAQFGTGASTFRTNIQNQLTALGSSLTPDQIVARAQSQSCGGCHQRSTGTSMGGGITFPLSTGFVQSSEFTETGPDGQRFRISTALTGTFLPHRQQVVVNFLDSPVLGSAFVSQSVPTTMTVGASVPVSLTFRNTGTFAWSANQTFKLGSQQTQDNNTWGFNRVSLSATDIINQGQTQQFSFNVIAPTVPGDYLFQWKLVQDSTATWFGDASPVVIVHVVPSSTCCTPSSDTFCTTQVCPTFN